ncbi:molybdopterin-dependent oxidoreductase [Microvirga sp. STS02]|uniref:molybdopterin-dependent oxidoreductase n=1 Tax=Hymenobacter negativus TaxID=2795026 RepID=UPI0018DB8D47|nr:MULTISPECIES: molybdopterin-dependent oxidoreductase [Bacteria]MBH8568133.1 molybdopterin-dependent oxidoreductase [Hymenobacter negativus]MBR7207868.1 molybdopterin-dependent oxidoreductase [Microvirga sp. STS02]
MLVIAILASPRLLLFCLLLSVAAVLGGGWPLTAAAQTAALQTGVQVISANLAQPVLLGPAQMARLPRQQVTRPDHDGKNRTYSGVSLCAVLMAAGAKLGPDLPRKGMAHYVLVSAADGYQAVFALAELNPDFAPRPVLLADRCDGQPLPATAGPYQIIVPDEKKMGRCVRQVQSLRVVAAQPQS